MGVHDGHRERLKSRFTEYGLDSFNELNALELLLFYAIPRKDTNVIAHELLDRFGSLSAVFDAPLSELTDVSGIGENAALLIRLIPQIMKKSEISRAESTKIINSTESAAEYLVPRFMYERDEIALLLCLDSKGAVIACKEVGRGVVNAVDTSVRLVVETALKHKATSVVLAHNHPDGIPRPSIEDDMFTQKIKDGLRLVGIELDDHIIVADGKYVSIRSMGLLGTYGF